MATVEFTGPDAAVLTMADRPINLQLDRQGRTLCRSLRRVCRVASTRVAPSALASARTLPLTPRISIVPEPRRLAATHQVPGSAPGRGDRPQRAGALAVELDQPDPQRA